MASMPRAAKSRARRSAICVPQKRWPARTHNRKARCIQNLRVAAHIQEHWWVVDLQQSLRIFRLAPVHQLAAGNCANRRQLFFRALERFFLDDGLRGRGGKFARFQLPQRRFRASRTASADAPKGALQCRASNTMPAREVRYRAARRGILALAAYVTDNLVVNYLL